MQQAATLDGQVQKRSQRGVGTEEAEEERRRGTGGAHDKYFRSPSVELWCAGQVLPRPGSGSSFHSGREGGQLQLLFQVVAAPPPHSERLTSGSGYVYELQHSTVISEVLPEASAHRGGSVAPGRTPLLRWLRSRTLSPSRHAVSHVAHGWSQEPIRTRFCTSIWVLVFQGPHCFPRLHRPRTTHHRLCAGSKPTITPSATTQPASLHSRHRTEQHATGCSPRPWPVRIARETAASRPALAWRLAARQLGLCELDAMHLRGACDNRTIATDTEDTMRPTQIASSMHQATGTLSGGVAVAAMPFWPATQEGAGPQRTAPIDMLLQSRPVFFDNDEQVGTRRHFARATKDACPPKPSKRGRPAPRRLSAGCERALGDRLMRCRCRRTHHTRPV